VATGHGGEQLARVACGHSSGRPSPSSKEKVAHLRLVPIVVRHHRTTERKASHPPPSASLSTRPWRLPVASLHVNRRKHPRIGGHATCTFARARHGERWLPPAWLEPSPHLLYRLQPRAALAVSLCGAGFRVGLVAPVIFFGNSFICIWLLVFNHELISF
jgi:hypothetical protein